METSTNKKIQSLSLKQFTAFDDVTFEFCSGINVLIGANSTGKTLTLKTLYLLLKAHQIYCGEKPPHEIGITNIFRFHPIFQVADLKELVRHNKTFMGMSLGLMGTSIGFHIDNVPPGTSYRPEFGDRSIGFFPSFLYMPSQELLSINQGFISIYQNRELPYDETYYDLSLALNALPLRKEKLGDIQDIIAFLRRILIGKATQSEDNIVTQADNRFYVELPEGKLEAHLIAEGYRKIATLLYLLRNGSLGQNSILFWDEPEANLNPKLIVLIVEVLKKLTSAGMQIFVTTHDYLLAHELSLLTEYRTTSNVDMKFFALHKPNETDGAILEVGRTLAEIEHNSILEEFAAHYDRETALFSNPTVEGSSL
jgi:AAA15 family ATPase/GTPase